MISYLQKNGLQLLEHRLKTPFCEIDLLFQESKNNLWLVEVKTVSEGFEEKPLGLRQTQRLIRSVDYLSEKMNSQILLKLATVDPQQNINLFEI